jgi:hypothetical protein
VSRAKKIRLLLLFDFWGNLTAFGERLKQTEKEGKSIRVERKKILIKE